MLAEEGRVDEAQAKMDEINKLRIEKDNILKVRLAARFPPRVAVSPVLSSPLLSPFALHFSTAVITPGESCVYKALNRSHNDGQHNITTQKDKQIVFLSCLCARLFGRCCSMLPSTRVTFQTPLPYENLYVFTIKAAMSVLSLGTPLSYRFFIQRLPSIYKRKQCSILTSWAIHLTGHSRWTDFAAGETLASM